MAKKSKRSNAPAGPPPAAQERTREQSSRKTAAALAQRRRQQEQRRNLLLVIAGIAVVGVIAVILISNASRTSGGVQASSVDTTLGPADAPVVMQDFSDFYCGHCRDFALDRLPALQKMYIDKGLLRVEFKNFPLRNESYEPAIAAMCAAAQGKFWQYEDALYKNQTASFSNADLKKFAADLQLDTAQFNTCLDQKQTQSLVQADYDEGVAKQVNSTPTLFVNGEAVLGAVPITQFQEMINRKLQEKGITPPAS